jgi:hypothetical protein
MALRRGSLEIRIRPLRGEYNSRVRKIARETAVAQTNRVKIATALRGAKRPKLMNVMVSQAASGFCGRKAPSSMGKISTAEVLRLRAASAVSREQPVRRSAQDDDSVGELTERKSLCGSRGAPQIPRLRSG